MLELSSSSESSSTRAVMSLPTGSPVRASTSRDRESPHHDEESIDGKVSRQKERISPQPEKKHSPLTLLRKLGHHSAPDSLSSGLDVIPEGTRKRLSTTKTSKERDSKSVSPKAKRKSTDRASRETSPTQPRKLSKPEKWKQPSAETRTLSMMDLKPGMFPYEEHTLRMDETDDTEYPISLQNPLSLLVSLNKGSRRKDPATFCYNRVIIEHGLENRVINVTDKIRAKISRVRTNQEFLNHLLSSIYAAGFVDHVPDQKNIDDQIKLLYLTALTTSPTVSKPISSYQFLAAQIPAYIILNEIAPLSLRGAKIALETAFPTIFPNPEHIRKVTKLTRNDGNVRFYFVPGQNTDPEIEADHVTVRISGPNDAEVVHNCSYKIFATLLNRRDIYPELTDDNKKRKYSVEKTEIPVGEMTINYTLQRNADVKHSHPLFKVEIRPSNVTRYTRRSLDKKFRDYPWIVKTLKDARDELKASLKKQLKSGKKYELDNSSILHCN